QRTITKRIELTTGRELQNVRARATIGRNVEATLRTRVKLRLHGRRRRWRRLHQTKMRLHTAHLLELQRRSRGSLQSSSSRSCSCSQEPLPVPAPVLSCPVLRGRQRDR